MRMRMGGLRVLLAVGVMIGLGAATSVPSAPPPPPSKPSIPIQAAPDADWAAVIHPAAGPARVVGGYSHGCIAGAVGLPLDGPGYTVLRPQRLRYFGHPTLIRFVQDIGHRAEADGWGTLLVGDLSQPRGGPMSYGHASHEVGLDVDIWFRMLPPGQRLSEAERRDPSDVSMVRPGASTVDPQRWHPRHAALLRAIADDPRVDRMFVNPAIKATLCATSTSQPSENTLWLQKVRPWYGHDSHVHIRLRCPADSPACEPQAAPPPGTGCDAETFAWWGEEITRWLDAKAKRAAETAARAARGDRPASQSVARAPQPLPDACQAILVAR